MRTILALLLLGSVALGDIVHLKSGGKIEGAVSVEGDHVRIRTKNGIVSIPKADVLRIEKKGFKPPAGGIKPEKRHVKLGPSYAHPFFAFKIYLPPRWSRGPNQGSAHASFYGPKDEFYTPRMDLRVEVNKKELHQYITQYKAAFRKMFKEVEFAFEEASAIRGKLGYQFSVKFSDGVPPLAQQSIFTFLAEGDRKYVLSFNCTQAWFDKYYGMVDASMRSLRIYPLPQADEDQKKKFMEHYNRAYGYYRQNMFAKALVDFKAAARIVPEFGDLYHSMGTIHMKQNRFAEAEAAYRKGIDLDPEDAGSRYNLGVCHLRRQNYVHAIAALKKAIELEPAMQPAMTNLGVAYLAHGLDEKAREVLEKAVLTDPESAPSHYNLGLAYERLGKKKDALREYKETIKINPDHDDAQKGIGRLDGGR